MAAHGYTMPQPLPANRRGWTAFLRVSHVRHYPMGQPHFPNWADIESILPLYNLWDADVHGKLAMCFTELLTLEGEQRKASDV